MSCRPCGRAAGKGERVLLVWRGFNYRGQEVKNTEHPIWSALDCGSLYFASGQVSQPVLTAVNNHLHQNVESNEYAWSRRLQYTSLLAMWNCLRSIALLRLSGSRCRFGLRPQARSIDFGALAGIRIESHIHLYAVTIFHRFEF